jgi:hypothetical protein
MKQRDLKNLLNRAAAALEAFANAKAVGRPMLDLTSTEVQELIEDLLAAEAEGQ